MPDGSTLTQKLEIAIGVVTYHGRLAFLQRHDERWTFPSGKVEPGETAMQAVIREIDEETGLQAIVTNRLGCHDADDQLRHYFFCQATGGSLQLREPEKFSFAGWKYPNEIIGIVGDRLHPSVRQCLDSMMMNQRVRIG